MLFLVYRLNALGRKFFVFTVIIFVIPVFDGDIVIVTIDDAAAGILGFLSILHSFLTESR